MTTHIPPLELDATTYPEWRDGILAAEASGAAMPGEPRSYPGYPRVPLDRVRPRRFCSLDRVLAHRRCQRELSGILPSRSALSRLLQTSHGITGSLNAGPVPSAGGLQALELYLVVLESVAKGDWTPGSEGSSPLLQRGWLPSGIYHYDRVGHHLSELKKGATRADWQERVPSLELVQGGSLLWLIIGDGERVARKYGERAMRFLLQESGHLMQNLCLVAASLGLVTVPLGGYFERAVGRKLQLLASDWVLYVGICGDIPDR